MKILLVYYSRTGHTRDVAAAIARQIGAQVERIADYRNREGWLGYIKCTLDQTFNAAPPIKPMRTDPTEYDIVAVGTPLWGSTCCAPIRTFLKHVQGGLQKAAFFCTMREGNETRAFLDMQGLSRSEPFATLAVTEDELRAGGLANRVAAFAEQCRTGMQVVKEKRPGET